MDKICTKCSLSQSISHFPRSVKFKSGYNSICKLCINAINKEWRDSNRDGFRLMRKRHYQENRERLLTEKHKYAAAHKQDKAEYDVEYRASRREDIAAYKRDWERARRNDPIFKIKRNLRRRIHHVLKDGSKSVRTFELIGCTAEEFKTHIESLFLDGMSWENYGPDGWHIDHIVPCYTFNLLLESEQRKCFHYTNQRPLWAKDNLSRKRH